MRLVFTCRWLSKTQIAEPFGWISELLKIALPARLNAFSVVLSSSSPDSRAARVKEWSMMQDQNLNWLDGNMILVISIWYLIKFFWLRESNIDPVVELKKTLLPQGTAPKITLAQPFKFSLQLRGKRRRVALIGHMSSLEVSRKINYRMNIE